MFTVKDNILASDNYSVTFPDKYKELGKFLTSVEFPGISTETAQQAPGGTGGSTAIVEPGGNIAYEGLSFSFNLSVEAIMLCESWIKETQKEGYEPEDCKYILHDDLNEPALEVTLVGFIPKTISGWSSDSASTEKLKFTLEVENDWFEFKDVRT